MNAQEAQAEIQKRIPTRLRSWSSRMAAKDIARDILQPLVPTGTLAWLAFPREGESGRAYADRAVQTAAAASSWAGGLLDGTYVYDEAIIRTVAKLRRWTS